MKNNIVLILFLMISPSLFAAKHPIKFNNTTYHLAYAQEGPINSINEYVPKGQNLKNWRSLIGVFIYHQQRETSPIEFARMMGKALQAKNPRMRFQILDNKKDNQAMIDFLTWAKDDPKNAEFNVFKFKKDAKTGDLLGLQYAYRLQPRVDKQFIETYKKDRNKLITLIAKRNFPKFHSK